MDEEGKRTLLEDVKFTNKEWGGNEHRTQRGMGGDIEEEGIRGEVRKW